MKLLKVVVLSSVMLLSACGEKVDLAQVSQNKLNGKAMAQLNANSYKQENFPNIETVAVGDIDSYVSSSCPQGDGYASFNIKAMDSGETLEKLQCRTWEQTGCFPTSKAAGKGSYMKNTCNKEVPLAIPKIN